MNSFSNNIKNLYGDQGLLWLESIPQQLVQYEQKYKLQNLSLMPNLTYHAVARGYQNETPIIIKFGLDIEDLGQEAMALKVFSDHGGITLLAHEPGMLLLECAVPGTSLKSYFPQDESLSIKICADLINQLRQAHFTKQDFPHIRDWLKVFDQDWPIPHEYLTLARKLRDHLLATSTPDVLLHGDLHHDNILLHDHGWRAIDPKGVVGEFAFEIPAFIRNPLPDIVNDAQLTQRTKFRIQEFSKHLEISPQRIISWCFVQAVLAWIWAHQDGLPSHPFEVLSKLYFPAEL